MAANTDVIAAGAVDLELEAMRKDDYSWQPCEVYLSPTGGGLVIKYENDDSQHTLTTEKEALMRIRARSLPLQDDDCAQIKPGETVLVNRHSESGVAFFDAEVVKVVRVRHSKRTNCRCTFKIKWLNQDVNDGSLTVPSTSVLKLANKNINNHPAISAFINAVQLSNLSDSDMSPQMDIASDFDLDLDLHNLLEKQIEGIRNSVHSSKKRTIDEFLVFEDVSKPNGRVPDVEISRDKSSSRRSTRSQKKVGPKKQTSPVVPPPIEDECSDKKSPLNPLAARAALASLMSHKSLEISIDVNKAETFNSSESESPLKPDKIVKKLFSTTSSEMLEDDDDDDDDDAETVIRSTRAKGQKVKVKVNGVIADNKTVSTNKRRTRSRLGKEEETETVETTTEEDTTTSHVQKDKNTLLTTVLKTEGNKGNGIEAKNSGNGRRQTRSVLNNEVSKTTEEIETKFNPISNELHKKRSTSGAILNSEGNVMSNGGRGFGSKKGLIDLKAQRVRSSPRLNPKT